MSELTSAAYAADTRATFDRRAIDKAPTHTSPREMWIVADRDGDREKLCKTREHAEALCLVKNIETPALGPWRVTRYREVVA